MQGYFRTISRLLREPRRFFSEPPQAGDRLSPLVFLAISSALSTVMGLVLGAQPGNLLMGAILFFNAFGMTLLAAAVAYAVMVPVAGRVVTFGRLFSVYAHSSGVTLLVSWNPVLLIFTECWKWWLVWTGIRTGCRLTRGQTAVILSLSLGMILVLFGTLLPLTAQ